MSWRLPRGSTPTSVLPTCWRQWLRNTRHTPNIPCEVDTNPNDLKPSDMAIAKGVDACRKLIQLPSESRSSCDARNSSRCWKTAFSEGSPRAAALESNANRQACSTNHHGARRGNDTGHDPCDPSRCLGAPTRNARAKLPSLLCSEGGGIPVAARPQRAVRWASLQTGRLSSAGSGRGCSNHMHAT